MTTKTKNILKVLGLLLVGIVLGGLLFGGGESTETEVHDHAEAGEDQVWTCSMHPQIRSAEPGDCPICGMDLIPLQTTDAGTDPATFRMSEDAIKLANIQTMIVGKGEATKEIRLNGKVQIDERNSYTQSSHIPGRIEKLQVNFTGEKVNKGQALATVYSPELVTAQEELLQAAAIRESQPELFEAAKEKLRNWRIGQAQIDQILASGKSLQRFTIRADVGGVVTEKKVETGDYVERGSAVYEISDLSQVWVLFDIYERELAWIKEGSMIEYTINSLPGETFTGKITFIDPLINSQTRVATARVEMNNKDGRLKPEMFATGYVTNDLKSIDEELIIPKSSVLWTGKRSVVYVKENGGFKMREVTLGAALGDAFPVKEGLQAGEEIVSRGTFTVDAAVQLSGRPSMMNPLQPEQERETLNTLTVEISKKAEEELKEVVATYLELKNALVKDDYQEAVKKASAIEKAVMNVRSSTMNADAVTVWESFKKELKNGTAQAEKAGSITEIRDVFINISRTMIGLVKTYELSYGTSIYIQHCPMANKDQGADWLSSSSEIRNPYYGSSMLKCGEVTEEIK